ncbi:MAG: DUF4168 domain-containing protein [Gemmatimonadetes bacterium]|nr:DUF4168 domain-containing protein [Gemmatimonadota bacterium]NIR79442.1 DUF4168 domain-containing protein [Gemmatimonadota bacterium]NIT87306.1 DUF4168 domain-containing protein [Gemmatimonadota bacterium]NIU31150.1 DUF4168 domain-containing protein [Gemmatimonadota bacterium]NIU35876.1 DUF4168 domain-containing protein [Gemmatimonadota bacterium]
MRARTRALITAAVPILAIGLLAAPTAAQETGGEESPAEQVAEIPDQELQTFAEAYVQIAQVRSQMRSQVSQAGSQEERSEIQQKANQQMGSILQDHGLSPQRYREITQTLNQDPAQRSQFQQLVQEIQGEESGSGG